MDLENFRYEEAGYIYNRLQKNLRIIPFSDYLKRYVHRIFEMTGEYDEIDWRQYREKITRAFNDNNAPASFLRPSTSQISALAQNWLTQDSTISRQNIFLLGFGLNMPVEDVSTFLFEAQERDFNFKDPIEIICFYCFKNKIKYPQMLELKNKLEKLCPNGNINNDEKTLDLRNIFEAAGSEDQLLESFAKFEIGNRESNHSVTSYEWFEKLYLKTRQIIAVKKNEEEEDKNLEEQIKTYRDIKRGSERLSECDKEQHIKKMRAEKKTWTDADITDSDVEKFLCCGTPIDESGNLLKFSESTLAEIFKNKRMNRQRIGKILGKDMTIDRSDLIMLNFFIFSHDDKYINPDEQNILNKRRFNDFSEETNKILTECSMCKLYYPNPHDCCLLMCIVSDVPYEIYEDVMKKSFNHMKQKK